jgi:PilZ domain
VESIYNIGVGSLDLLNRLQSYLKPSQTLQLTIWDPDNETVEYVFHGAIKESTGFLVRVSFDEGVFPPEAVSLVKPGDILGALLEVNPTPLFFYPNLHSLNQPGRRVEIWLRLTPETNIELMQNRAHVRVTMRMPFSVGTLAEGPVHPAYTVDLSGGGVRFTSQALYVPDQVLAMRMPFSANLTMTVKAKVISSENNPLVKVRPEEVYTVRTCFVDLEPGQEPLIVKECFRQELMLKRP